jgi:hypothetical protein
MACGWCGKVVPKGRRKYCSERCYYAANRAKAGARYELTCLGCEERFHSPHRNRKYCSRDCYRVVLPQKMREQITSQSPEWIAKRAESARRSLSQTTRECVECGKAFAPTSPPQKYCSGQCFNRVASQKKDRRHRLKRATAEEYAVLVSIFGKQCNICGATGTRNDTGRLCVDHIHGTDEIRGLLCHRCNTSLGLMRDDPSLLQAAVQYLEKEDT